MALRQVWQRWLSRSLTKATLGEKGEMIAPGLGWVWLRWPTADRRSPPPLLGRSRRDSLPPKPLVVKHIHQPQRQAQRQPHQHHPYQPNHQQPFALDRLPSFPDPLTAHFESLGSPGLAQKRSGDRVLAKRRTVFFGTAIVAAIAGSSSAWLTTGVAPSSRFTTIAACSATSALGFSHQTSALAQGMTQPAYVFEAPPAVAGRTVYGVQTNQKVVALTFDDGPRPGTTERILNALAQTGAKATFFWTGYSLRSYPDLARRAVQEGHAVGNHTWSHIFYPLDRSMARQEIEELDRDALELAGVQTRLFRPPGGLLWTGTSAVARERGYAIIHWTYSPYDTDPKVRTTDIRDRVVRQARPGQIILMHDDGGGQVGTAAALPQIIARLRGQGYRFLTIPQLLQAYPPILTPPPNSNSSTISAQAIAP